MKKIRKMISTLILCGVSLLVADYEFSGIKEDSCYSIMGDDLTIGIPYKKPATGNPNGRFQYAWIFPRGTEMRIGNSIASYQYYDEFQQSIPRFHRGLDIQVAPGTPVKTVVDGRIVNIRKYYGDIQGYSDLYYEVVLRDINGYVWEFHHIDKNTIPQDIYYAFNNEVFVKAGTNIGEVVAWPFPENDNMNSHHIHLNIKAKGKNGDIYVNPLNFFRKEDHPDFQAPEFVKVGLLRDGTEFKANRISGDYSIFVHVHDIVVYENGDTTFLPPYELSYSLDGGDEHTVWKFDTLPGGGDINAFVHNYYVQSMVQGNYENQMPVIDLGFSLNGNKSFTREVGTHSVTITAKDFNGNAKSYVFSWEVKESKSVNIGLNNPVVATGRYMGLQQYIETNINDGDEKSVWGTPQSDSAQYAYIELPHRSTVDSVVVRYYENYFSKNTSVYVGNNSGAWKLAGKKSDEAGEDVHISINAKTDKVGLYFDNTSFGPYGITEFEVYGSELNPNNIIINDNFSQGMSNWEAYINAPVGAYAIFTAENNILKTEVLNGGTDTWHVFLYQKGLLVEQNKEYVVTFDAWAESNMSIKSVVGQSVSPYVTYSGDHTYQLSTEKKRYTYRFVMANESDSLAQVNFDFGGNQGIAYIDNVEVYQVFER